MQQKRGMTPEQGQIDKQIKQLMTTRVLPLFSFTRRMIEEKPYGCQENSLPQANFISQKVLAALVLSPWQWQTLLSDICRALKDKAGFNIRRYQVFIVLLREAMEKTSPYEPLPKGPCKSAYPLDPCHLQCDAHHACSGHSTSDRQTCRGISPTTSSVSTHLWL